MLARRGGRACRRDRAGRSSRPSPRSCGDRPYYRGRDALALAGTVGFEQVAAWLWTGASRSAFTDPVPPWQMARRRGAGGRCGPRSAACPTDLLPLDRLPVIVTVLGAAWIHCASTSTRPR